MPRSRNIKPSFCQNEQLVELPYETRLMFALLPCFADREGRLEDRPKRIKMQMFPADDLNTDSMLDDLQRTGFIKRYEINGSRYIQIINFLKHQKPHNRETESVIPALGSDEAQPRHGQGTTKDGPSRADSLNPLTDSLNPVERSTRKPKKTGSRLHADWKPSEELQTWAMTERPDLDIQKVIDSFTDYWIAKTGAQATKLDWDATFRNWVRNEKSNRTAPTGNRAGESAVQRRDREAREALERLA